MRVRFRRIDARDERGAVAAIVVVTVIAMLGMVALVVDGGSLLLKRRAMVTSADSAALAYAESCALLEGSAAAAAKADELATNNVDDAAREGPFVTTGDCDQGGTVTATYTAQQSLAFAPVLGLSDEQTVRARATAVWGVAGGFSGPAPFMLDLHSDIATCDIPNVPEGTQCSFWVNNGDLGDATWAAINLDQWDYQVGEGNCSSSGGAGEMFKWMNGININTLSLNWPDATYVCVKAGANNSVFFSTTCTDPLSAGLICKVGQTLQFPVNCIKPTTPETVCPDPTGQIDSSGNSVPFGTAPYAFDIIGFASLQVISVLHGNDPVAIGTQPSSGNCSIDHDFTTTPPGNTFDLTLSGCQITNLSNLTLTKKIGSVTTTYVQGVDYQYDATAHVITWTRPLNVAGVKVRWNWSDPGSPGACPGLGGTPRPPDPNAVCFVSEYDGYSTGGIDPDGGADFGVRAIGLSG